MSQASRLILVISVTYALCEPAFGTQLEGAQRTSKEAIKSFLWPEENFDQPVKYKDVRDLQNLSVFESVKLDKEKDRVEIKERWTTIPIAKVQSGGGVNYFTLGVFDPNVFGELVEMGAQYESLAGQDSGVIWFRKPRLFGRTSVGADLWNSRRLRFLYDDDAELESGFVTQRQRYNFFAENQLHPELVIGVGLDWRIDSIATDQFDDDFQQSYSGFFNESFLEDERQKVWARLYSRIGRINEDVTFFRGELLSIELAGANGEVGSVENLVSSSIEARMFRVYGNHNLGGRLRWDLTNSPFPEDQIFVGGFDRVRGFQDGQYYGHSAAVANLEHRYRFYRMSSRWVELQSVGFVDGGIVGGESFASVGGGLRFLSPRIYRFNARIDFAFAVAGVPGNSLSFGLQQFF